jgi:hypothetical protein
MFLDYINNFLTIGRFADYYGLEENEAQALIDAGRIIHNSLTED